MEALDTILSFLTRIVQWGTVAIWIVGTSRIWWVTKGATGISFFRRLTTSITLSLFPALALYLMLWGAPVGRMDLVAFGTALFLLGFLAIYDFSSRFSSAWRAALYESFLSWEFRKTWSRVCRVMFIWNLVMLCFAILNHSETIIGWFFAAATMYGFLFYATKILRRPPPIKLVK